VTGAWLLLVSLAMLAIPLCVLAQTDEDATVVSVNSGNTIDVQTPDGAEHRVRLIGVNAPRVDAPEVGDECYGPESRAFLTRLVEGRDVVLERDVTDRDASGRLLRYVRVPEPGTGKETRVGIALIAGGYAVANPIPPDLRMAERYSRAEAEARAEGNGLWSACD